MELNRRFLAGYLHFQAEPKVKKLRDDVLKYNRMVRDLGLRDHQVGLERCTYELPPHPLAMTGAPRPEGQLAGAGVAALPPGSSGVLERPGAPRRRAERADLPRRLRAVEEESTGYAVLMSGAYVGLTVCVEALAGSVVKISGRDVMATWKILISLGLTPVVYGFYGFLATLVVIRAGAPFAWRVWTPVIVFGALPCVAYAALKFGEAGVDVLK